MLFWCSCTCLGIAFIFHLCPFGTRGIKISFHCICCDEWKTSMSSCGWISLLVMTPNDGLIFLCNIGFVICKLWKDELFCCYDGCFLKISSLGTPFRFFGLFNFFLIVSAPGFRLSHHSFYWLMIMYHQLSKGLIIFLRIQGYFCAWNGYFLD